MPIPPSHIMRNSCEFMRERQTSQNAFALIYIEAERSIVQAAPTWGQRRSTASLCIWSFSVSSNRATSTVKLQEPRYTGQNLADLTLFRPTAFYLLPSTPEVCDSLPQSQPQDPQAKWTALRALLWMGHGPSGAGRGVLLAWSTWEEVHTHSVPHWSGSERILLEDGWGVSMRVCDIGCGQPLDLPPKAEPKRERAYCF